MHKHTHTVYNQTNTFCTKLSNFIHINSFYQLNCTRLKFIHISFFLLFNNKPSINKDLNKTNVEQKPTVFEKLCWLLMQVSNWTLISCQPHRTVELCRKQTQMSKLLYKPILKSVHNIVQELCESQGGRPGLSILTSLLVSVDVKIYWTVLRHWSQLVPNMSTDIRGH